MNLYMVHVGFYDPSVGEGLYESHMNFFVAAADVKEAKTKTLVRYVDGDNDIQQLLINDPSNFFGLISYNGELYKPDDSFYYCDGVLLKK